MGKYPVKTYPVAMREQGRRRPDGAAAKLLQIVERTPEAVLS